MTIGSVDHPWFKSTLVDENQTKDIHGFELGNEFIKFGFFHLISMKRTELCIPHAQC